MNDSAKDEKTTRLFCTACGKIDFDTAEECRNSTTVSSCVGDWVCNVNDAIQRVQTFDVGEHQRKKTERQARETRYKTDSGLGAKQLKEAQERAQKRREGRAKS
ncbi:MAG: hypothetical protein V7739_20080 [Motiliproteus sp.]